MKDPTLQDYYHQLALLKKEERKLQHIIGRLRFIPGVKDNERTTP